MAINRFTAEENINQAKELLAKGFSTKAAQKNAMEKVSNAFDRINDRLSTFLLSKDARNDDKYEGAYWDKPSYIHQFKDAKHGGWYEWVGKREMANELLALRNEIKAAPIVKVLSKTAQATLAAKNTSGSNFIEAAVFPLKDDAVRRAEKEANELVARVAKNLKANGMDVNAVAPYPRGNDANYDRAVSKYKLYGSLTQSQRGSYSASMDGPRIVEMSDIMVERFIARAKEDAAAQYDMYVQKLIEKIGEVTAASLDGDHVWGFSHLTATKPDGTKEVWKTQMIVNVSKLGKLFNQFPTRKMK